MNPRIEIEADRYAGQRNALAKRVAKLNAEIEALRREALPAIKRLVGHAAEQHGVLKALIEDNAGDFIKPRTVVLHGIKIGFRKNEGRMVIEDEAFTLRKINDFFGEESEAYLNITIKPDLEALATVPANDLKRLGITITDTGDVVVIKPADSDVDKIVNALLKGATEEEVAR